MKRILFWAGFVIVLGLIVWGMVVAMNKPAVPSVDAPAPVTSADHVRGPSSATVTVIEYGDFQCPACGAYYPLVERAMAAASTTARLVFRHFPLAQHNNAMIAAQASEAAAMQGKFWDMHKKLYEGQAEWDGVIDPHDIFSGYAKDIGLDIIKFKSDIDSNAAKDAVTARHDEGVKIGIAGTPTFFVNGKVIQNPNSYEQFKALIDAAAQAGTN